MKSWRRATVVALLVCIFALGSWGTRIDPQGKRWDEARVAVRVYFGSPDASGVVPEYRWFPPSQSGPRERVEALIAGPRAEYSIPSLPKTTRLLSVERRGDTIVVDFSQALVRDHPGGSAGELVTVYSVVDTLTEIPGVARVSWRIDGKPVDTLVGHLDLSAPVERDEEIIISPVDVHALPSSP